MRKLIESTFVSLGGVIGDPQVWGPPYLDGEHAAYANDLLSSADALLLGRRTYEGLPPHTRR
jgi:dihydrofolate reductase